MREASTFLLNSDQGLVGRAMRSLVAWAVGRARQEQPDRIGRLSPVRRTGQRYAHRATVFGVKLKCRHFLILAERHGHHRAVGPLFKGPHGVVLSYPSALVHAPPHPYPSNKEEAIARAAWP